MTGFGRKYLAKKKHFVKKKLNRVFSCNYFHILFFQRKQLIEVNYDDSLEVIEEKIRMLEFVRDEIALKSLPASGFSRSGSARYKKSNTPRPPWKF